MVQNNLDQVSARDKIEMFWGHGEYQHAIAVDEVTKVFEIKAGTPPEVRNAGGKIDDTRTADTRRFVKIYDSPAGYIYHVDDPVYTRYELDTELPDVNDIVDDVSYSVEHAMEQFDLDVTDAFEIWSLPEAPNDVRVLHQDVDLKLCKEYHR
jgi:hypothetical protein